MCRSAVETKAEFFSSGLATPNAMYGASSLIVFQAFLINTVSQWSVLHRVRAQNRAISALATYGDLVVAGSSDSELKVYSYGSKGQ